MVNSPDAENHGSSSEHSESSHAETHESKQNSDSHSSGPPTGSEQNKSDDSADSQQDSQSSKLVFTVSSHSSNGSSHSSGLHVRRAHRNSSDSSDRSSTPPTTLLKGPGQYDHDLNILVSIGSPRRPKLHAVLQKLLNSSCTPAAYPRVVHGEFGVGEASASAEYLVRA